MEGEGNGDSSGIQGRWTCEACGCHTNTTETLSCGICGTRRVPSLLRRAGHSAASRLFSRSFATRRGSNHEDQYGEEVDDLDSDEMGGDEEEQVVAALALEVSGVTGAARAASAQGLLDRRLRSLRQSVAASSDALPSPDEILVAATENASLYQPRWADATELGGRNRGNVGIVFGSGEERNVAHLAVDAGEGKAVRAAEPFPRGSLPVNRLSPPGSSSRERKRRRIFGFRVAFDHPRREVGLNMGGCYLVGVTTASFHAFSERHGLQQSRFFWGIEDTGRKFEGGRRGLSTRGNGHGGVEIRRSEAPRNSDDVLFGSREVVTIVVDLETRTLTFWRDDRLLGTLVTNLPRSGHIYPVVVPFNSGVSVAISGMDRSPIPLLQNFASDRKRSQHEDEELQRKIVSQKRSFLIQNGKMTPKLVAVLTTIFSWYTNPNVAEDRERMVLDSVAASRLWYRCGMKLSSLESIFQKSAASETVEAQSGSFITVTDFLELVARIVQEDEDALLSNRPTSGMEDFDSQAMLDLRSLTNARSEVIREKQVGDMVELVDGHEKFGDALSGPLQPGDRGRVVEVQQGPKNERNSIRVLFNGRTWWYQPQALLTERSGLIETPAVWFLRCVLRSHGYDHNTLQPLVGKQVTASSWQLGDLVAPSNTPNLKTKRRAEQLASPAVFDSVCIGRITVEASASASASSLASQGRESGTVLVEFIDPSFGLATGVLTRSVLDEDAPEIYTKRVRVGRLVHASCFHGPSALCRHDRSAVNTYGFERTEIDNGFTDDAASMCFDESSETIPEGILEENPVDKEKLKGGSLRVNVSEKVKAEISGVARLESAAIDLVKKECGRSTTSLAGMFAAGLPDAVLSAIDRVECEALKFRGGRDLSAPFSSLGMLAVIMAKQLFPNRDNGQHKSSTGSTLSHLVARDVRHCPSRSPFMHERPSRADPSQRTSGRRLLRQRDLLENSIPQHISQMGLQGLMRCLNDGGELSSSSQQRRRMLLSLLSNTRANNAGENNLNYGLDGFPTNATQVVSSFGQLHPGAPFLFGQENPLAQGSGLSELAGPTGDTVYQGQFNASSTEHSSLLDHRNEQSVRGGALPSTDAYNSSFSVLESVLRGRGNNTGNRSTGMGVGTALCAATKSFIQNGLLGNSLVWVRAITNAQTRRDASKSVRSSMLSGIQNSDEEGTSLLVLAVSLGCSEAILSHLICSGASVGEGEIYEAAYTNQPGSLSVLLRHSVFSVDAVDLNKCSPEVTEVLRSADERQKAQEKNMLNDGRSFASLLLGKLLHLGLTCRRHRSRTSDKCGRVVSDTLVGSVLLHAMHRSQQQALKATKHGKEGFGGVVETDVESESGRVPVFGTNENNSRRCETNSAPMLSPLSLLEVLPVDVLCDTFVTSQGNPAEGSLTTFLLLIEAFLWSRDPEDVVVGLTLVSSVMRKIPMLCFSTAVDRYGVRYLALKHEALAKDALSEIMAQSYDVNTASLSETGVVVCPKNHVAELHLTRHSSFRCDLCGKGVERGKPMHGCRNCDWDACARCTDKLEGGIVKWVFLRELSVGCQRLLSATEQESGTAVDENIGIQTEKFLECLRLCEHVTELDGLAARIQQRDFASIEELASLLGVPGQITMFEFASHLLPALHSALVGRRADHARPSMEIPQLGIGMALCRRSKKPRVGGSFHDVEDASESLFAPVAVHQDMRYQFGKEIVESLTLLPREEKGRSDSMSNDTMDDPSASEVMAEANSSIPPFHISGQHEDGAEDEESDDDSSDHRKDESQKTTPKLSSPELLRRLNDVLAFNERVAVLHNSSSSNHARESSPVAVGDLYSLTHPLEIELIMSTVGNRNFDQNSPAGLNTAACVYVEPLMPLSHLQLHILRTRPIRHPLYCRFCHSLASEHAIIAERPLSTQFGEGTVVRRFAMVVGFDSATGAHMVRYASRLSKNANVDSCVLDARCNIRNTTICDLLEFDGEEKLLVLAARDYFILYRTQSYHRDTAGVVEPFDMETELLLSDADVLLAEGPNSGCELNSSAILPDVESDTESELRTPALSVGMRVESVCKSSDKSWRTCTITSAEHGSERGSQTNYVVVSDEGEVFHGVPERDIRGCDTRLSQRRTHSGRDRLRRDTFASGSTGELQLNGGYPGGRPFPFLSTSQSDTGRRERSSAPPVGVLKRTWSALSPIADMSPLELSYPATGTSRLPSDARTSTMTNSFHCSLDGREVEVLMDDSIVEFPPFLRVEFSLHEALPTTDMGFLEGTTVFCGMRRLFERDETTRLKRLPFGRCKLFYSIVPLVDGGNKSREGRRSFEKEPWIKSSWDSATGVTSLLAPATTRYVSDEVDVSPSWTFSNERGRKPTAFGMENDVDSQGFALCEGIDESCVQCMEILSVLAEAMEENNQEPRNMSDDTEDVETEKAVNSDPESMMAFFESEKLTNKLVEQLEDPMTVVGGALPEWCTVAPTFAPRIFSYASRRLLLERAAFGVSRSALKQQEAKVAVGPLRRRMAALRGRAVELVGEAFSGGADDPTALQLQADELYGMEEALAARVNAAFRAQKWNERSLQCAKAAVRRERLLSDAAAIMDRYANDVRVCRRRLEVRFEGESGFDASLDEAGVTRGFYSDIAEQLLSCNHVSGVYCKPVCASVINEEREGAEHDAYAREFSSHQEKLPLWIPDMDSSGQVVIPTPRADPCSHLGVYPRPLSTQHPQFEAVVRQFRFMGRLFAAALRDGFVFPLPLSVAFLELVQRGNISTATVPSLNAVAGSSNNRNFTPSFDMNCNPFIEEMSVSDTNGAEDIGFRGVGSNYNPNDSNAEGKTLKSANLPRPGFLGGDVYAVEVHVCAALDKLDEADPPLSKLVYEKRCKEIASDNTFATKALGKSYDCSFEEYFENKFFVDPFDPSQGEEAIQLCPNGHLRSVTIHNVREWVALAREFILYEGVIWQALAFRRGVEDFFSSDYLRLFTAEELQRDICGGGDNVHKWDESNVRSLFKLDGGRGAQEALVAVAAIGGEGGAALSRRFGPASPTVSYLVKALLEAPPTKRRQFLSFVTSVPIITPGQIEVVPMVSPSGEFLPMRDPGCLPRANTCARRLYLPKFESYESFSQVLWAVVREESRFKGFYEWRG